MSTAGYVVAVAHYLNAACTQKLKIKRGRKSYKVLCNEIREKEGLLIWGPTSQFQRAEAEREGLRWRKDKVEESAPGWLFKRTP